MGLEQMLALYQSSSFSLSVNVESEDGIIQPVKVDNGTDDSRKAFDGIGVEFMTLYGLIPTICATTECFRKCFVSFGSAHWILVFISFVCTENKSAIFTHSLTIHARPKCISIELMQTIAMHKNQTHSKQIIPNPTKSTKTNGAHKIPQRFPIDTWWKFTKWHSLFGLVLLASPFNCLLWGLWRFHRISINNSWTLCCVKVVRFSKHQMQILFMISNIILTRARPNMKIWQTNKSNERIGSKEKVKQIQAERDNNLFDDTFTTSQAIQLFLCAARIGKINHERDNSSGRTEH